MYSHMECDTVCTVCYRAHTPCGLVLFVLSGVVTECSAHTATPEERCKVRCSKGLSPAPLPLGPRQ